MDSLIVDLDKVLDDFEAEENAEVIAPGQESKHSGFEEYLQQHNEAPWKMLAEVPISTDTQYIHSHTADTRNTLDNHDHIAETKALNVMYDIPYEPADKFDMSEADFAPSPTVGDKSYNGSIYDDYGKQSDNSPLLNSLEQHQKRDLENNFQNQYDGSNNYRYVQNELETGHAKLPVQAADMSPDAVVNHEICQMNGHMLPVAKHLPKQNNTEFVETVPQRSLHAVKPSTETVNQQFNETVGQPSNSEHKSKDTGVNNDKLPIQCNTPQTPKDNQFTNPFEFRAQHNDSATLPDQRPTMLSSVSPMPGAYTPSSSQNLHIQNIPLLQPLKQEIMTTRNDFTHNLQGDGAYNSLPPLTQLVMPTKVHSSLPTELEVTSTSYIQPEGQRTNYQNGITTSIAEPVNTFVKQTIQPQMQEATVENNVDEDEVAHMVTSDGHSTPAAVGFTDTDLDVSEQDLADYLGQSTVKSHTNTESESPVQSQYVQDMEPDPQYVIHDQQNQAYMPGDRSVNTVPKVDKDEQDGLGRNLEVEPGSPVKMDTGEWSTTVTAKLDNSAHDGHMQSNSDTCVGHRQSIDGTGDPVVEPAQTLSQPRKDDHVYTDSAPDFSDLEIFKALPADFATLVPTTDASTVIAKSTASETTDVTVAGNVETVYRSDTTHTDTGVSPTDSSLVCGARPKEISQIQTPVHRPNSLQGLSLVDLNADSPFVVRPCESPVGTDVGVGGTVSQNVNELSPKMQKLIVNTEIKQAVIEESRQLMDVKEPCENYEPSASDSSNTETTVANTNMDVDADASSLEHVEMRHPPGQLGHDLGRPHSWSPINTGQAHMPRLKRPMSLNLPPRPQFTPNEDESPPGYEESFDDVTPQGAAGVATMEVEPGYNVADVVTEMGSGAEVPYISEEQPMNLGPPPPYSTTLGNVAPKWVPDAEAPNCMSCDVRFTFTKRRHHCRACGKVYCSACCYLKGRLKHLGNREARVCVPCHNELAAAELWNEAMRARGGAHPNNPADYCSTVPPPHQATYPPPAPSVLVPVTGVLKHDATTPGVLKHDGSNRRSEPKQVMFSDGIRPGGDLTELDGSTDGHRMPPRRSRIQKRVERVAQEAGHHSPRSRRLRTVSDRSSKCLIPEDGLPPLAVLAESGQGYSLQLNPDTDQIMPQIRDEEAPPVIFAINTNLYVLVKILNLDCCVNRVVWCFTTRGMSSVGQDEILTVLETVQGETTLPLDIFTHLNTVYEDASKGSPITEMGHTIFNQSFLGSRDHGGFLYIRATFQCVQKLVLPTPPFLFAILLQKWETPWAKVFPVRLLLRLGAEYRYYPCPLIGVRDRKPVYFEIGHTIMNLLADFRNYQYMLPNIPGISIHMEDKVTHINFPRNRYDELMKVVNNSNEHVMAIGATFSADADSHLVCIQNDDGNYQTQAINIQNKPRKVTGASFVVFNGALKSSSGLTAKSSIVEDGLMVQIMPDSMLALKQAIRDMQDYTIVCGVVSAPKPDETVIVQWTDDDKNVNIGVKSPIDKMALDGVQSLRIPNSTDYVGDKHTIRWTEIFFIENEDSGSAKWEPVDLSRLGETLAKAFCLALTSQLDKLKQASLTRIGLRVRLAAEQVGYEAGARGERLPDTYMNELDNELIPVIHRALQGNHDGPVVLELIFQILD